VRRRVSFRETDAARPAALGELPAKPALPDAGISARPRRLGPRLQGAGRAPPRAPSSPRRGRRNARSHAPGRLRDGCGSVRAPRARRPAPAHGRPSPGTAEVAELKEPRDQGRGVLGQVDPLRPGELPSMRAASRRCDPARCNPCGGRRRSCRPRPPRNSAPCAPKSRGRVCASAPRRSGGGLPRGERRVARPPGVILVGDGRAEERHDAVAGVLVHGPSSGARLRRGLEEPVEEACHSSGSSCSARSIEPFTSAKRTVTCLRSPSRARGSPGSSRRGVRACSRAGPRRLCRGRRRAQTRSALLAELGGGAVRVAAGWAAQRAQDSSRRRMDAPHLSYERPRGVNAARDPPPLASTRRRRLMAPRHGSLRGAFTLADAALGRRPRPAGRAEPSSAIDRDRAAEHLAAAIRFRTVSHQDPSEDDRAQFAGYALSSRGPIQRFTVRSSASS